MAWFAKHRWSRQQADLERKALAASVEEITAQTDLSDDVWDEENESTGRTAIFPPLLRLQSRSLPVVHVNRTKRTQVPLENRPHTETRLPAQPKRLGRSTRVHLQAVRPDEQQQEPITERVPTLEAAAPFAEENSARSGTMADLQKQGSASTGFARIEEPEQVVPDLQPFVVPDLQAVTTGGSGTSPQLIPAAERSALSSGTSERMKQTASVPQPFAGSGTIEQGEEQITVASSQVSAQSVVVVMLAGNPGPVVVQYILLHPKSGFTCHLSAPVSAPTPFNYLVWSS